MIGDTIGIANPRQTRSLVAKLVDAVGRERLAMHFHDTRGTACGMAASLAVRPALFSHTITGRAMLALQAVYKTLGGLGLVVISAPVLILASLLIAVSTGGPAMEHIECPGLERIPFQMFRFRTGRRDGSPSSIGTGIKRLRLTYLPQLINVFRGEMGLWRRTRFPITTSSTS